MTTDEDIIKAASEAYAEALRDGTLSARAGEWDRAVGEAVVAAVRPLIGEQTLREAQKAYTRWLKDTSGSVRYARFDEWLEDYINYPLFAFSARAGKPEATE